jgi:hypothetical protein
MGALGRFSKLNRARIALLGLGVAVLTSAVFYYFRLKPVDQLQPFIGKDLRTLSEEEQIEFDDIVGKLIPQGRVFDHPRLPRTLNPQDWQDYLSGRRFTFFIRSWYLWKICDAQSNERLILFQGMPCYRIPGASMACVFVMDTNGTPLRESSFSTGWRIDIHDARWLEGSGHGFPCLLVCSSPSINGGDITSQYYALLDDAFALVRLEDSTGEFVTQDYHHPNFTIGPSVPKRTAEEWEAALRSREPSEVLRTLVWLGGSHSDPPIRDAKHINVEGFEDASLALEVRARPGVQVAVEALTRSEDRWVREAAHHAWEAIRDHGR